MYHYTESGLDYVWLRNGYTEHQTDWGDGVSIDDVEGLHHAIASDIAHRTSALTGAEFRFLRRELNLAQRQLAQMWEVDVQTIANYEKGKTQIPTPAATVLRMLYRESQNEDSKITTHLQKMIELDNEIAHLERRLELLEDESGHWATAPIAA